MGLKYPLNPNRTVTPRTEEGLKALDYLPPMEAVLVAWRNPGPNPEWHKKTQAELHDLMPLLARALDRFEHSRDEISSALIRTAVELQRAMTAIEAIKALHHEDFCCTKGCPGYGLASCDQVTEPGDTCDGAQCTCCLRVPLLIIKSALGE